MKVFKSNELQISSCAGRKQEDLILSIVKPLNPTTLSVVKFRKNPTLIRNFNPNAKRIFLCVSNPQGMPDSINPGNRDRRYTSLPCKFSLAHHDGFTVLFEEVGCHRSRYKQFSFLCQLFGIISGVGDRCPLFFNTSFRTHDFLLL